MFFELYVYIQLVFLSFILLMLTYNYMLVFLLVIEVIVTNIAIVSCMVYSMNFMEFMVIYYMVFSICEGVLGLGLLVVIIRFYGSEMYYMFNLSKF